MSNLEKVGIENVVIIDEHQEIPVGLSDAAQPCASETRILFANDRRDWMPRKINLLCEGRVTSVVYEKQLPLLKW